MAVGSLSVNVVSDTAKARKNLKSFRGEVTAAGKATNLASKSFKKLGLAAAGFASAATFRSAFRTFRDAATDINKLADTASKLGLATDQLAGLRFAAEQTGVGAAALDTSLQRMTRRVAEAAQGTGEAKGALRELGLEARELVKLAPDRQFRRVADAMRDVKLQGDKVRLTMKLFDSEGVGLVTTMADGSKGLDRFTDRARKLGLAVKTGVPQVRKFNQAMGELNAVTKGAIRSFTIDVAPQATKVVQQLVDFQRDLKLGKYPVLYSGSPTAIQDQRKADIDNYQIREKAKYDRAQRKKLVAGSFLRAQDGAAAGMNQVADSFRTMGTAINRFDAFTKDINRRGLKNAPLGRTPFGVAIASSQRKDAFGPEEIGKRINSFRHAMNRIQREGLKRAVQGLNPLTGLAPLEKSSARAKLEAQKSGSFRHPTGRINSLVEADSYEGYLALRANRRSGRDGETGRDAKKTAVSTTKTATATEQTAERVGRLLDLFSRMPAPASA